MFIAIEKPKPLGKRIEQFRITDDANVEWVVTAHNYNGQFRYCHSLFSDWPQYRIERGIWYRYESD